MKDDTTGQGHPDMNGRPEKADVVTRRAGIDDYSTIRHIQAAAIRTLGGHALEEPEVARAVAAIYTSEWTADLMAKTVLIAEFNNDLAGTCAWGPSDDRGSAARISALFVLPLLQGHGIGRRLVVDTEKDAVNNGFTRFTATVPVAVLPLFAALGYVTASFGTSRDVVPATAIQVAFLRKPH